MKRSTFDARIWLWCLVLALRPDAARAGEFPLKVEHLMPPGDYVLQMRVIFDHNVFAATDVDQMTAAYRATLSETESRQPVRKLVEFMAPKVPSLLRSLENMRSYEQASLLGYRDRDRWRIVAEVGEQPVDAYFDSGRVVLSGVRGADGKRVIAIEEPRGYAQFGPMAAFDLLLSVPVLVGELQAEPVSDPERIRYLASLGSLRPARYFGLRMPLWFPGMTNGVVRVEWTTEELVIDVRDDRGAPVIRRAFEFADDRISRFREQSWLPGVDRPFVSTTVTVVAYTAKRKQDSLFSQKHFENLLVIDKRGGITRMVPFSGGRIPTDEEFERLHGELARRLAEQKPVRRWPLGLTGVILGVIGLEVVRGRWRRKAARR